MSAMVILLMVASSAVAQEPASVDSLLDKLAATKKQQVELSKLANDLTAEINTRLLDLQKRLAEINGVPVPIPPSPPPVNDPLKAKIATAFAADPGTLADKKADAGKLSALYSVAVEQKLADDPTLTTVGQLIARVRAAGASLAADRLPAVRKVISEELTAVLKSPDTTLDPAIRSGATAAFARIEAALDEVSK
jgi:hypothetical protein